MQYKEGVYSHVSGGQLGLHAIKMLGYVHQLDIYVLSG